MTRDGKLSQTQSDRRAEIARAALRVLEREGHAALTARKVAAEAGLALGHISYHFNGMDEVLAEAYQLLSARLREASDASLAETSPRARLEAFLRAGFTSGFLTPGHIRSRIDLWSAAAAHPAVAKMELELYTHYRTRLESLLQPLCAPERLGPLADTIMATLDGLWLDWMRRRDHQAIDNGLATLMTLIGDCPRT